MANEGGLNIFRNSHFSGRNEGIFCVIDYGLLVRWAINYGFLVGCSK